MKELFESLWDVAPQLMSVVFIFSMTIFICLKISQFYLKIENMDKRLTRLEEKVDMIIEYLFQNKLR